VHQITLRRKLRRIDGWRKIAAVLSRPSVEGG